MTDEGLRLVSGNSVSYLLPIPENKFVDHLFGVTVAFNEQDGYLSWVLEEASSQRNLKVNVGGPTPESDPTLVVHSLHAAGTSGSLPRPQQRSRFLSGRLH